MTAPTTKRERKPKASRPRKAAARTAPENAPQRPPKPAPRSGQGPPAPAKAANRSAKRRSSPADVEIDGEVLQFIEALDRFKKEHNKPFPSWSEVLHVIRGLGYRKVD